MNVDIEQLIKLGLIPVSKEIVIKTGSLTTASGVNSDYRITHGWDVIAAYECDTKWKAYRIQLAEYIDNNYPLSDERDEILKSLQVEDAHWNWILKSCHYKSDEYKWFFLKTNESIEVACLMHHPKSSVIDGSNIFYIEFIAVAPWNRDDPMESKRFSKLGSIMLKAVIDYSVNSLGLKYGFSLHSLPQAEGFYKKIGMERYSVGDKDHLSYFEMKDDVSKKFIGAL